MDDDGGPPDVHRVVAAVVFVITDDDAVAVSEVVIHCVRILCVRLMDYGSFIPHIITIFHVG